MGRHAHTHRHSYKFSCLLLVFMLSTHCILRLAPRAELALVARVQLNLVKYSLVPGGATQRNATFVVILNLIQI